MNATIRFPCLLLLLLALPIASLSGCHHAGAGEDDDHLEHHDPEHKPKSFASAVQEIRTRLHELEQTPSANSSQPAATRRSELLDIINWIPELAAQTDLKKNDWGRVKAISSQLLSEVPPDDKPSHLIDDTQQKRVESLLAELERLVKAASQ